MSEANTQRAWPEGLTPELHRILGLMCFQLGKFAQGYREIGEFVDAAGEPLASRAEDEQAFMLHKFLGFWFVHGAEWGTAANADIERVIEKLDEKTGAAR